MATDLCSLEYMFRKKPTKIGMLISGHIMWDVSQTVVTIPSDFM